MKRHSYALIITTMNCARLVIGSIGLLVAIALWPYASLADIVRKPFWTTPSYVDRLSEENIDDFSQRVWGQVYNLFDDPVSCCEFVHWDNGQIVGDYFVLDRSQCLLRYFGTGINLTGNKEVKYLKTYGAGRGSGNDELNDPEAVTMSPLGPLCQRQLYVLDTGNQRIQKLSFEICGDPLVSHVAYIYDAVSPDPAYGPLNNPQDIDYCDLYQDTIPSNDFLVVADTDNHRVLVMDPDGAVLASVGGPDAGSGKGKFSFPCAVTATKLDLGYRAVIYVADRGNNRIVRLLKEHDNWNLRWEKELELPSNPKDKSTRFEMAGLEDIEVDDTDYRIGVFALDSRRSEVLHLDFKLETIIGRYGGFFYDSAPLHDLSLSLGELLVMCPYTQDTGTELFEFRAAIERMSATPDPLVLPLEWVSVEMSLSGTGLLDVWVENSVGGFIDSLLVGWPGNPGMEYALWDGKDEHEVEVAEGTYTVKARMAGSYWGNVSTDELEVTVTSNTYLKKLAGTVHQRVNRPNWSPDGKVLVYSAEDGGSRDIVRYDLQTQTETVLTNSQNDTTYWQPVWSPHGDRIAYVKLIPNAYGDINAIYIMDADGQNVQLISDLGGAPPGFSETNPKWVPSGDEISYVKWTADISLEPNRILKKNLVDMGTYTVFDPSCCLLGSYTLQPNVHTWAPNADKIAVIGPLSAGGSLDPEQDVYVYDLALDVLQKVTPEQHVPIEETYSVEWSPISDRIAYVQWNAGSGEFRWDLLTLPSGGGEPVPASGLGSDQTLFETGVGWSPDGTELAIGIPDGTNSDLYIADYIREDGSTFPSAYITTPLAMDSIGDIVAIVGTVDSNISVLGTPLSSLEDYYIQWGKGQNPESWSSFGIDLVYGCPAQLPSCEIVNDTLATWRSLGISDT